MNINTQRLQNLLGSEEAAQRFVDMFRKQLPAQLEALREALASKDWETVANVAHGIKSQCRYMALDEAAELLQQIENQPDQAHDWGLLDKLLQD